MSTLAGGASSPVRTGASVGGSPFVQVHGAGAYAYDRAGRAFVDYLMAYGPLLFGHAHPALVRGLDDIAARGTVFGNTCEEEERLAARIGGHLPSIQALRFVSTGTEAVMSAVRVARAFTQRTVVLRFAGNYHGHFDDVLSGAGASASVTNGPSTRARSGIPAETQACSVVARYNDLADVDARLATCASDLAAILVEPIVGNMGLVLPDAGFLEGLFARARASGALVIFDEVITWLRVGLRGAQGATALAPDLTALGKAMGGGFALAAFGGRADVMEALSPRGAAFTGGTFSGNPFGIAIGHRVLDLIEGQPEFYTSVNARAEMLAHGLRRIFAERSLPYAVVQHASMVDFAFRPGPPVRDLDERASADARAFAAYYHGMRDRGVLLAPSSNELMFVSSAHRDHDIERTLEAADATLGRMRW